MTQKPEKQQVTREKGKVTVIHPMSRTTRRKTLFVVSSPIADYRCGRRCLATDHRWVPEWKMTRPDWLGGKPERVGLHTYAGVADLGRPVKQYDRYVRSA